MFESTLNRGRRGFSFCRSVQVLLSIAAVVVVKVLILQSWILPEHVVGPILVGDVAGVATDRKSAASAG